MHIEEGFISGLKNLGYNKILIRTIKKSKAYIDFVEDFRQAELKLIQSLTIPMDKYNKMVRELSPDVYLLHCLDILDKYVKDEYKSDLIVSKMISSLNIDVKKFETLEKLRTNYYNKLKDIVEVFKMDVNSLIMMVSIIVAMLSTVYLTLSIKSKLKTSSSVRDEYLTTKMREIVKDDRINVYMYINKNFNACNIGTPDLFYSSAARDVCNDRELIAVLLHEYGHYATGKLYRREAPVIVSGTLMLVTALLLRVLLKKKLEKSPQLYTLINIVSLYVGIIAGIGGMTAAMKILSKPEEHIADSFAIKYGYGEEAKKIDTMLLNAAKSRLCTFLPPGVTCEDTIEKFYKNATHPSGIKRLQFVEIIMKDPKLQKLLKASSKIGAFKWVRLTVKLLIEFYSRKK